MDAYVSLVPEFGGAVLIVIWNPSNSKIIRRFRATPNGCRAAGRILARLGHAEYSHSSTLDFPQELGIDFDPHRYVREGICEVLNSL